MTSTNADRIRELAVSLRKGGSPCKSRRKDVEGGDAWTLGNLYQKEICRVTLSKSVHYIERAAERRL
jgi:hypothetical protein